jgi:Domain of unknown function (DUF1772)
MNADTIRTAQVIGLVTPLFLSGVTASASYLTLPLLYTKPPSVSAPVIAQFFKRAAFIVPPMAVISIICPVYLAITIPDQRSAYAIASTANLGIVPWTLAMMKTYARLITIGGSKALQQRVSASEVTALMKKWTWMNFVRSGMFLVAGLAALQAKIDAEL